MKTIIASFLLLFHISLNAQCWKTVSPGADFCIALKQDGTLWSWGNNSDGQLGIGVADNKQVPTRIGEDADWESVSAGYGFAVALKTNGTLWVWGRNDFGLGNGATTANSPSQIGTSSDWTFISAGGAHTLAIKNNGTLWGWGRNDFGQLGNGTFSHTNIPIQVGTDSDWETAATGTFHSLAVKTNHTLWSWGYNFHGQLGQGTAGFGTEVNTPTPISTLPANTWKCIASGGRHSMAITEEGSLWVWGNNNNHALGIDDGSFYKSLPARIDNATNWKTIAGGIDHTLAVKADNTLWGWGENTDGQLGDGSNLDRALPVQIGTTDNWLLADGGLQHSVFFNGDTVLTSGDNQFGELGIDSLVNHNTPQSVACPVTLGIGRFPESAFIPYPNPASQILRLHNPKNLTIDAIAITDSMGKTIPGNATAHSEINIGALQSGLYCLHILSGTTTFRVKFIKI